MVSEAGGGRWNEAATKLITTYFRQLFIDPPEDSEDTGIFSVRSFVEKLNLHRYVIDKSEFRAMCVRMERGFSSDLEFALAAAEHASQRHSLPRGYNPPRGHNPLGFDSDDDDSDSTTGPRRRRRRGWRLPGVDRGVGPDEGSNPQSSSSSDAGIPRIRWQDVVSSSDSDFGIPHICRLSDSESGSDSGFPRINSSDRGYYSDGDSDAGVPFIMPRDRQRLEDLLVQANQEAYEGVLRSWQAWSQSGEASGGDLSLAAYLRFLYERWEDDDGEGFVTHLNRLFG